VIERGGTDGTVGPRIGRGRGESGMSIGRHGMEEKRNLVKAKKGRGKRGKRQKGRNNMKVEGEMEGVRIADEDEDEGRQMIPMTTQVEQRETEVGLRHHGETQKTDFSGRDPLLAIDLLRRGGHLARIVNTLWMTFTPPRTVMITFVVVSMFLTPWTMTWCHHLPIHLHFPLISRAVVINPTCITITLDLVLVPVIFHLL